MAGHYKYEWYLRGEGYQKGFTAGHGISVFSSDLRHDRLYMLGHERERVSLLACTFHMTNDIRFPLPPFMSPFLGRTG